MSAGPYPQVGFAEIVRSSASDCLILEVCGL